MCIFFGAFLERFFMERSVCICFLERFFWSVQTPFGPFFWSVFLFLLRVYFFFGAFLERFFGASKLRLERFLGVSFYEFYVYLRILCVLVGASSVCVYPCVCTFRRSSVW